jgi:hypothetical protein
MRGYHRHPAVVLVYALPRSLHATYGVGIDDDFVWCHIFEYWDDLGIGAVVYARRDVFLDV